MKTRRRYGEPTRNQYDSAANVSRFGRGFYAILFNSYNLFVYKMVATEIVKRKMSTNKNVLKILACLGLASCPFASGAEVFSIIDSKPVSELWLNPGFYSYHFQKNKGLNNSNFGLGGEYRYSTINSVTLGVFDNSDRQTSHYAGWYWQPLGMGPVRLGAVVGVIDGYPRMRDGGWFVAAMPVASIEYRNVGANLMFIPSYKDKLYGSISLQLRFRVF